MTYARVHESIVIEVFVVPQGFTINDCFTPEIVAQFEPCPDEVKPGWIKQEDGTFVAPPPPPPLSELPAPPAPEA